MIEAAADRGVRQGMVRDFARSEMFNRTFADGMELVEETAAYLDGGGRRDSKLLSKNAALAYAAASMRLTTRLMQIASWLLVQRAVRQGDMPPADACHDRYRLTADRAPDERSEGADELPPQLVRLCDQAERLYGRIAHLDRRMYHDQPANEDRHPVLSQFDRLNAAFGPR